MIFECKHYYIIILFSILFLNITDNRNLTISDFIICIRVIKHINCRIGDRPRLEAYFKPYVAIGNGIICYAMEV